MNGTDLLAKFRATGSEHAFSEIVRRYTNLVYSVARRRLANTALVQDITQTVFIRLAKAAPGIRSDAELMAWLHRTTVNASIDLWRSDFRRRAREQHAIAMQTDNTGNPDWSEIAPIIDDALNELNTQERQVLLLRFFDQKTMREVGQGLGISEDAAKMRVSRALERLRSHLSQSGVNCTAVALAPLLIERSVESAPSAVIIALAAIKWPSAVMGFGTGVSLGSSLSNALNSKVLAAVGGLALLSTVAIWLLHSQGKAKWDQAAADDQSTFGTQTLREASLFINGSSNISVLRPGVPDPVKLLQGIIRGRQRIWSGEMEFQVASYQFDVDLTNQTRLRAVFDGGNRRFESFAREYSYVSLGPEGGQRDEAQIRERRLDREAAVRAGFLRGFESHHVTAFDGNAIIDYWETDGKPEHADIIDPSRGTPQPVFDPRVLGLDAMLSSTASIEEFSRIISTKSVTLIDDESLEVPGCWHVRAQSDRTVLDFWIDAANTNHVLKHKANNGITISMRYDVALPQDVLPTEVRIASYSFSSNGMPRYETRITRISTRINIPVDPASWTLAGLGIKVGTPVTDTRNYRIIGYWNGTGLEELPGSSLQRNPPNRGDALSILDNDPGSEMALDAAQWVLLNTPDGADVEKAALVILHNHISSTNLTVLAIELERMRHRCSRKLLETILEKNSNVEIRGNACFSLAVMRKDEANYGKNKQAAGEAIKLFQRVHSDFSRVQRNGRSLDDLAKPELAELANLTIGHTAPDISGKELDGQPIRLRDYRGRVLLLVFWEHCCLEAEDLNKLAALISDGPAAIIGINSDHDLDRAKSDAKTNHVTWPSFWDGRDGSICTAWNVKSWPTTFVLDRKGVIRYRNVRQGEMAKAVETLLNE